MFRLFLIVQYSSNAIKINTNSSNNIHKSSSICTFTRPHQIILQSGVPIYTTIRNMGISLFLHTCQNLEFKHFKILLIWVWTIISPQFTMTSLLEGVSVFLCISCRYSLSTFLLSTFLSTSWLLIFDCTGVLLFLFKNILSMIHMHINTGMFQIMTLQCYLD